ncbi:hypothetical protein TWF506_011125 [Arthrobotrys conoides]|uniref:Uncharacterized protein n=1 Tax=Arthrobotrys conoides TaxID=74498 RepID=A0AAN8RTX3_9PEZI
MSTPKTIKGVRVNCLGDHEKCHRPRYEPVEIPITDPIFSKQVQSTSDIADRLGIPLFTRQCPRNPLWADSGESSSSGMGFASNQEAAFLHLSCNPTEKFNPVALGTFGFGWAPEKWQYSPGSFIAVRQDKKPLDPLHMEALCKYCLDHVQPLFGHHCGEYAPDEPLSKEAVLSMICRPTFSIYWYKRFVEENRARGGGYVPLASLYEA